MKVRVKYLCLLGREKSVGVESCLLLCVEVVDSKKASIWPLYPGGDASVYHYTGVIDKVSTRGGRELP